MDPASQTVATKIFARRAQLAEAVVAREFALHPELNERYGAIGRAKSLQDANYHLAYLGEALAADSPALFSDYVAWAKVMLAQRNVLPSDLAFHLECLSQVLREQLPGESGALPARFVEDTVRSMSEMPDELPTCLHAGEPLSPLAHQYLQALLRGERHLASRLILEAVERGTSVKDIYMHVFQPSQHEIGRLWQINHIIVAQEHYCTAATQLIMSQLYPMIFSGEKNGHTLVAACVSGELHELGVRMVADFFEMEGWNTFYVGANLPAADVVRMLVEHKADMFAVSATITYHLRAVEALIATVRAHPECGAVKILVGGYPFNRTPDLWKKVGADGFAADARQAIETATHLIGAAA